MRGVRVASLGSVSSSQRPISVAPSSGRTIWVCSHIDLRYSRIAASLIRESVTPVASNRNRNRNSMGIVAAFALHTTSYDVSVGRS